MSLQKVMIFGSAVLVAVGLVLRLIDWVFGFELMLLGVFTAVVAMLMTQRSAQNLLSTTRRSLTQRLRDLDEAQEKHGKALKELAALQRTTLWYAKNRTDTEAAASRVAAPIPQNSHRAGLVGRASTPDVTNAAADVSFASLLDPARGMTIGGVLSDPSRRVLPSGTTVKPFLPGRAVESLAAAGQLDLVVLDEEEFSSAPWSRSFGPAGIGMMKDLLDAIGVAHEKGIPTVVLPFDSVPDIHSAALRNAPVLRLPLPEDAVIQTAGAPLSALLGALDNLAVRRRSM